METILRIWKEPKKILSRKTGLENSYSNSITMTNGNC